MIRIVGIQHHENVDREFVLLQNQCSMRILLRGHALVSENALRDNNWTWGSHFFTDETHIPPSMYVMVHSGRGEPYWGRSKDGSLVFHTYLYRRESVWFDCSTLHILKTQHSFSERREALIQV